MTLPPASRKLVEATPLHPLDTGVKACIEFTVFKKGHTGIAVSRIEGNPPKRRIVQADSMQLNSVEELRAHVEAIIDHVARHAQA